MKFRVVLIIFFQCLFFDIFTQDVPSHMKFADIELHIKDDAASIIKERMKKLTASAKFFEGLKNKYLLHAPIIQRVFKEQQVPLEFVFLPIMESSLNPMAVSSSNAVGYWQFKKESGAELGLRIDDNIDERKNIVSSSIAACKYLKRSNALLDNWVLSCQSYNVGLGGTKRSVDNSLFGTKQMTISSATHEYVVKYLAYILLFQNLQIETTPSINLLEFADGKNMTLDEIASKAELNVEDLKPHNQWLKTSKVPDDKIYPVLIPVSADKTAYVVDKLNIKSFTTKVDPVTAANTTKDDTETKPTKKKWWQVFGGNAKDEDQLNGTDVPVFMTINGLSAIQAKPGDNLHKLANQGKVRYKKFLKFNEMRSFDDLVPGKFYYLQDKKNEASVLFHVVQPNESLWDISQKYGVTSKSIQDKNRMHDGEALVMGRKLYLKNNRPSSEPVIIEKINLPAVKKDTVVKTKTIIVKDTVVRVDTVVKKILVKETIKSDSVKTNSTLNLPEISDSVWVFHEVLQGQTLYAIHKKYNTPIDSILIWNQLQSNALKLGAQLKVQKKNPQTNTNKASQVVNATEDSQTELTPKPKETVEQKFQEHLVLQGETLYGIARKYGVTVTEILQINNMESSQLKTGMTLKVPKK